MATAKKPVTRTYDALFLYPDDMGSLEQAAKASKLTSDDPGLKYAATLTAQRYANEWRNAATTEERELMWCRQRALTDVMSALLDIIEGFTVAQQQEAAKPAA